MRIPTASHTGEVGINMTPMIDVVFQLLIFFLVSSHLSKQEAQMPLPLPAADSGQEPRDTERPRVTINVLHDGSLLLAGHPVTHDDLPARLKQVQAQDGRDVEIRIRSDRTVPYRVVEPILLNCVRAGVWNVAFAVYHKRDVAK